MAQLKLKGEAVEAFGAEDAAVVENLSRNGETTKSLGTGATILGGLTMATTTLASLNGEMVRIDSDVFKQEDFSYQVGSILVVGAKSYLYGLAAVGYAIISLTILTNIF